MTSYRADKDILGRVYQFKSKMTLKIKVNHTHFQKQPYLSQDLVILAEIGDEMTDRRTELTAITLLPLIKAEG